jgi:hypothetical protein
MPGGGRQDLAVALEGAVRGKKAMSSQMYKIRKTAASDNTVVIEVVGVGTLAMPFGSIPAGSQMKASFAVSIEFQNGRIVRQRNHDCCEPW